ncbi:hypothetical protein Golob_021269 [Gossypium lobatum]|uniref:Uncharacterized protein n=1 Tax=Gossypium lobatum TaxID=34289 RepID=A0A7J8LD31_9ROSI|nr:hypothetical protein [Gossypium lobatum]
MILTTLYCLLKIKLSEERDSLAMTAKKLSRDFSKQAETVDIGTCDQSVPKAYPDQDDGINDFTSVRSSNGSMGMASTIDEASRHAGQIFSRTLYIAPQLTPTGTEITSTSGSPSGYSAAGSPPKTLGATSPTKPQYDGQTSVSWYSSSHQLSAADSPPRRLMWSLKAPKISYP